MMHRLWSCAPGVRENRQRQYELLQEAEKLRRQE
jgi:hypothetical protein